jgi:hypothetical protein
VETQLGENHKNFSKIVSRFYKHQLEGSNHSLIFPSPNGRRHQSLWNILNIHTISTQTSNTIPKSLLKYAYKNAQSYTSNLQTCKIHHKINFPLLIMKYGPKILGYFLLLMKQVESNLDLPRFRFNRFISSTCLGLVSRLVTNPNFQQV